MRETVKREIDGSTYEVMPLPPKDALRVLTRLSKIVGEPLGALAAGALKGGKGLDATINVSTLDRALGALTARLDEDQVVDTIELLLTHVHVRNPGDKGTHPIGFEMQFTAKIGTLLKVTAAALEVNFGDFFGGSNVLGAILAQAKAAAVTNQGPETPIG